MPELPEVETSKRYIEQFLLNAKILNIQSRVSKLRWEIPPGINFFFNNTIILKNNASITLNGIAQGWITDKVVEIINKNNIKNTLVDFGETFASGSYESKRPWNIEIQSSEGISTVLKLTNKAVATSSASGTMFEPTKKYNHIFNPKTGLSTGNFNTVSIISNKAWLSDCIATSALLLSTNKLKVLCDKLNAKAFISEKNYFKELT